MRPNILFGSLWALGWCALALGQTNQSRPSSLRDSGVISRAAPPLSVHGNSSNSNSNNGNTFDGSTTGTSTNAVVPTNFPTLADNQRSASTGMSDQAWTSGNASPTATASSPASSRLSDNSTLPPVVSAQHSINDQYAGPPQPHAVRQASAQAPVTGVPVSGHEPKPLKPPTNAGVKETNRGTTGTVQMFVSVMSSLAIVIGLILAAAWFYRKAAPTISGALPKQVVQVLGRTPLAPRQQLVLLRLGSKLVLVSNLHGEVRTISEITDPLEVDRLSGLCEAAQPGSISESFRSVLHNMGRNG